MAKQVRYHNESEKNIQFLKVATVAMQCDISSSKNQERMIHFIKLIKKEHPNVDLIVFGETILGWYSIPGKSKQYHQEIAETIPGETTNKLSEIAKSEKVYLSFGMSEREGDSIFNTQVIINADGGIDAIHRKFFMRDSTFQPGRKPVAVSEIKGVKTGIVICFDIRCAEVRKALLKSNVDLIIHSMVHNFV